MREKIRTKTRVRLRNPKDRDAVLPVTSPTLLLFLVLGILAALAVVYFLVKYMAHMGGVSDQV